MAQQKLLGRVGIADVGGQALHVQIVGEFASGRLAVEDIRTGEEHIVRREAFVSPLSLAPRTALLTVSQATDRARAMVGDDNLLGQEDYQVLYDNLEEADRYPFAIALLENGVHVRSAAKKTAQEDSDEGGWGSWEETWDECLVCNAPKEKDTNKTCGTSQCLDVVHYREHGEPYCNQCELGSEVEDQIWPAPKPKRRKKSAVDILTNPFDEGDPLGKPQGITTGVPKGMGAGVGIDAPNQPGFAPWGPENEEVMGPGTLENQLKMEGQNLRSGEAKCNTCGFQDYKKNFPSDSSGKGDIQCPQCNGTDIERKTDQRDQGKYHYENFEVTCVCGHSLGVHASEAPRPCFNGDQYVPGATGEDCNCEKFKKSRTASEEEPDPDELLEKESEVGWSGSELVNERWAEWKDEKGYKHGPGGDRTHRIVMEEELGRKLKKNEDVHHKDHDKNNNSPSNLEVIDHAEHGKESGAHKGHLVVAQSMSEIINSPTSRPKSSVEEAQEPFMHPQGLEPIEPAHDPLKSTDFGIEPIAPIASGGRDMGLNPSTHEMRNDAYTSDNQWEDPDLHLGQVEVDADWFTDKSPKEQTEYKQEHPKSKKSPGGDTKAPKEKKKEETPGKHAPAPNKALDAGDKEFLKSTKIELNTPVKLPSGRMFTLKQEKPGGPFQPHVEDAVPETKAPPSPPSPKQTPPQVAPSQYTKPQVDLDSVQNTLVKKLKGLKGDDKGFGAARQIADSVAGNLPKESLNWEQIHTELVGAGLDPEVASAAVERLEFLQKNQKTNPPAKPASPPSKGMGDIIDTEETSPGNFEPKKPPRGPTTIGQEIAQFGEGVDQAIKDVSQAIKNLDKGVREKVEGGLRTLRNIGIFFKNLSTSPQRLTGAVLAKIADKLDKTTQSIYGAFNPAFADSTLGPFFNRMKSMSAGLRKLQQKYPKLQYEQKPEKTSSGPYEGAPALSSDQSVFDEMGDDVDIQVHAQSAGVAGDLYEPEPLGDGVEDPASMNDIEEDVKEPGAFGITVGMIQLFSQGVVNRVMDENLGPDNIGEAMNDTGIQRDPETEDMRSF